MPAPFTHNDLSGSMWPEQRKRSEKAPDYKGEVSIDGKVFGIAAWNRKTGKGRDFLSLKVTRPEEHAERKRKEEEWKASRSGIPTAPPPPPLRAARRAGLSLPAPMPPAMPPPPPQEAPQEQGDSVIPF